MKRLIVATYLVAFWGLSASNVQANEAVKLLNRMSNAVHNLDYHGELLYTANGDFKRLKIIHVVDENGMEYEKVSPLDDNNQNNKNTVQLNLDGFSFGDMPQINERMLQAYAFDIGGKTNVAGRECYNIVARPKDRMRYFHEYCIDTKTDMLLNYGLVNSQRKTMENMRFTSIHFEKKPISANEKNPKQVNNNTTLTPFSFTQHKNGDLPWEIGLPPSFEINKVLSSHYSEEPNNGFSKDGFTQVILTDRVSSVSVFIEPELNNVLEDEYKINSKSINPSLQAKGAINSLTLRKSGHILTAVGDVPRAMLEKILNEMHYISPKPQ
jgi:sigma-E factor negative regulatory protein RseB